MTPASMAMFDFSIRTAASKDLAQIIDLGTETIKNTCQRDYNQQQIEAWITAFQSREKWLIKLKEQYFLVAEAKGKIVGFTSLADGDYIDYMYINKDYLRQGIAHWLYQALEEKSLSLGKKVISSDVSITARPFFEKIGFTLAKENRNLIKGIMLINYRMTKKINS